MVMNNGEDRSEHQFTDGIASLYRFRLSRVERRRRGLEILFDKALEAQALSGDFGQA
jgi:hypothetical protein